MAGTDVIYNAADHPQSRRLMRTARYTPVIASVIVLGCVGAAWAAYKLGAWAAALSAAAYAAASLLWKLPEAEEALERAEDAVFAALRTRGVACTRHMVPLSGPEWADSGGPVYVNSVCCRAANAPAAGGSGATPSRRKKPVLVLIHGLAAGLGMWAKNIPDLVERFDVWCVDLLGFGRSSSPKFERHPEKSIVSFWVDALHCWRQTVLPGVPQINMVGHSLGSYVAAAYALAYPCTVNQLALAAPVGLVPVEEQINELNLIIRLSMRFLYAIGGSRSMALRALGPMARFVTKAVILGRKKWYGIDSAEVVEYVVQLQMLTNKTGDAVFRAAIDPRVGWREPLFDKLPTLCVGSLVLVYGTDDFVDHADAARIIQQTTHVPTTVKVFHNEGHHMFSTAYSSFNDLLVSS
ncbi:Abhydrolase domain-containing protein cgi-58 [Diplonema papillatum]|nr:Abhydrolase domain-containing protein cgi-58 [Diplonema papillatum]